MRMPPLATRWESPAPVPVNALWRPWGGSPAAQTTQFQPCRDVSFGGVLCALPALAANGLLRHLGTLPELSGYYRKLHVILLLAYMALCRIKIVERLQYESPGELGKLLGLDRIPEVRCLRNKVSQLSQDEAPQRWAGTLSQEWLEQNTELAGTLYVDGHVRLYHGRLTKLPKRYVTRQRLCLRGTTDYWVNDALGQPFFSIERPIDHGMLEALHSDIVPRLLKDVPRQPTDEELQADPYRQPLRDHLRSRRLQSGVLPPDVAGPPHRLHHLPQISRKMPGRKRGSRETDVTLPSGETVTMTVGGDG